LKLLWEKIPFTLGQRIKYSELSDHPTKAKNIVIAFEILHAAMLAERIFPTTDHKLPIAKKDKAAPKVFPLDIGLSTQALGLTKDQLREHLIKDTCAGGLMEAFVHQELLATDSQKRNPYFFWIREEKDALAETDFLYVHQNQVLPIEVKSGSSGSLKSLHQYLYRNKKSVGVRLSSGNILINDAKVAMQTGEVLTYRLYSLPLYLASRLEQVID
jgi:predicted AAA+ superfamily ATPase